MTSRSSAASTRATWLRALVALAVSSIGSAALPQGPGCDQEPVDQPFRVQNRSTMLYVGGSLPFGADQTLGLFQMRAPDIQVSMRFTAPENQTLDSVWIHLHSVSLPPSALLRVSVKQDLGGQPFPVGAVATTATFFPTKGWQRVAIPTALPLVGCDVYHVVVQPGTPADFNSLQGVEFVTNISRYPVEYQAEDPSSSEFRSFHDLSLAFMLQEGEGFLTQWKENHFIYNPIFAIQAADGTISGQPYNVHYEPVVLGDTLRGQRVHIETATTINHASVFSRGTTAGGDDLLQAEIYDASQPPGTPPLATSVVVRTRPGVTNRAHWFGGTFNEFEELVLAPGDYFLMLRSLEPMTGTASGYHISMERSTLPVPFGATDPTFGGTASHAVLSIDGGTSFVVEPGGPDMAFLLSYVPDIEFNAVGIFDEGGVYYGGDMTAPEYGNAALTAHPGQVLDLKLVRRNIGPAGDILWHEVLDGQGASIVAPTPSTSLILPNTETTSAHTWSVPLTYTSGDLLTVRFRVGNRDHTINAVVYNDEVRFEIRIE